MQLTLNELDVCRTLLRLIGLHELEDVRDESLQALCALMLGGLREVQDTVYKEMTEGGGQLGVAVTNFFSRVCKDARNHLRRSTQEPSTKAAFSFDKVNFKCLPMLRCIQMMTDFSHAGLQNFLRNQHSPNSVDIVTEMATLLSILVEGRTVGIRSDTRNIEVATQLLVTLSECISGPCVDNQLALLSAKILITCLNLWAKGGRRFAP